MPNARVCPQCGRQAHDPLIVQCPDCRVPFLASGGAGESVRPVASAPPSKRVSILGAWQLWAALVLLTGSMTWGVVRLADKIIDERSRQAVKAIEAKNAAQMAAALSQISNQINAAFRQPRIQSAIDDAAWGRASDLFSNGIKPSIEAFQTAVDQAKAQLASATNLISQLQSNALAAEKRIPPPPTNLPVTEVIPAAVAAAPAPAPELVKLSLVNRSIVPAGTHYLLTLFFKTVGTPVAGPVEMDVATYKQTARILNFSPMTALPFQPPVINPAGDIAQLRFTVTDRETPTLVLEVSAPTIVRFISDSMDGNLTIPIAAEKMVLPATGN